MSQWTHVIGCLYVETYKEKKDIKKYVENILKNAPTKVCDNILKFKTKKPCDNAGLRYI